MNTFNLNISLETITIMYSGDSEPTDSSMELYTEIKESIINELPSHINYNDGSSPYDDLNITVSEADLVNIILIILRVCSCLGVMYEDDFWSIVPMGEIKSTLKGTKTLEEIEQIFDEMIEH